MNILWIKIIVILCYTAILIHAADEHRPKIKKDPRGKRNLEYSIAHHYPIGSTYRLERRISTIPQPPPPRYNTFYSGPRTFNPYHKIRPHTLPAPPYAVQMEPLVHYSQRDPLYDTKQASLANVHNDLTKPDDLVTDNNHLNEHVQEHPHHYVERPIYIREPEPIIEIIIKESNVTLPPVPVPPVTPAPKKKEEVQVFYVKYKKNPHGQGKDSIIYDAPVPAISPPVKDDDDDKEKVHEPIEYPAAEYVTSAPPPSTTLRAIIKPESEVFHSDHGIHVTFGDEHEHKNEYDDANEESAPRPAISFPQGRQLSLNGPSLKRNPTQQRFPPQTYRPFNQPSNNQFRGPPNKEINPTQNRPFPPPPLPSHSPSFHARPPGTQFNSPINTQFNSQLQTQQTQYQFNQRQPVAYRPFDQIRPQPSNLNHVSPQQQQIQFPRPPTHFPIQQQLPLPQQQYSFNHQRPQQHQSQISPSNGNQNHVHHQQFTQQEQREFQQQFNQQSNHQQPQLNHQQQSLNTHQQSINNHQQSINNHQQSLNNHQQPQSHRLQFPQPNPEQFSQNPQPQFQQNNFVHHPQQSNPQQLNFQNLQQQNLPFSHFQSNNQQAQFNNYQQQNQNGQQQLQQSPASIIPPGGELIASVPKYEQHISIPTNPQQNVNTQYQQESQQKQQFSNSNNNGLSADDYRKQIQQQFITSPLQNINGNSNSGEELSQNSFDNKQNSPIFQTTQRSFNYQSSSTSTARTTTTTTTTTTTETPKTNKEQKNPLNIQLPDEVPDDLREQLLSSGILANAQISILDYDKVGDIPLSALPPDQLANFYNAGGASQIASGSQQVQTIVDNEGNPIKIKNEEDQDAAGSEVDEIKVNQRVEMKVVHFDPQSEQGMKVKDSYVKDDSTQIEPVVLNDQKYTKYLPLKVSGEQFPIPDVPELKGKNINSVVVLAPVDYTIAENARITRDVNKNIQEVKFISGPELKQLLDNPTKENFEKWLEYENNTSTNKQSVILLVTGSDKENNREIFMYDVTTKSVSKLNGELSTAFVEAAETNANDKTENIKTSSSNIIETKLPAPKGTSFITKKEQDDDLDEAASEYLESKVPIIDPINESDLEADGSERFEKFVDVSGLEIQNPSQTGDDVTNLKESNN